METRMFLNMRVSMYFLHLELTFTPHYIIMDKGLLIRTIYISQLKPLIYVIDGATNGYNDHELPWIYK